MDKDSKKTKGQELAAADAHLIELISNMPIHARRELIEELGDKYSKGKRRSIRENYFKDVDFATKYQVYRGFIQNISDHGMLVETRGSFSVGQKIIMSFVLPNSDEQVKMPGEIVRVLPEGRFAVKFYKKKTNDELENQKKPVF
jgi:Tfp pilus assembly protein PilZ